MKLKKYQRSIEDRRVAGVFGGLGEAFGVDPAYLRLAFILFALVTGVVPAVLGYFIGWLVTQEGPSLPGLPGRVGTDGPEKTTDSA